MRKENVIIPKGGPGKKKKLFLKKSREVGFRGSTSQKKNPGRLERRGI